MGINFFHVHQCKDLLNQVRVTGGQPQGLRKKCVIGAKVELRIKLMGFISRTQCCIFYPKRLPN